VSLFQRRPFALTAERKTLRVHQPFFANLTRGCGLQGARRGTLRSGRPRIHCYHGSLAGLRNTSALKVCDLAQFRMVTVGLW